MRRILSISAVFMALHGIVLADSLPGYFILTTTNIIAHSTELTNFVASKEARGFDVTVVDNEPLIDGGWGGGTGDTAAENLREWLSANYTNENGDVIIDYVLFVGDPNPRTGDVPMKLCDPLYPGTDQDGTNGVPTDLYYASLNSDWDVNTNGVYGQWADLDTNSPPWNTEFVIGRIPYYGTISDLDAILDKTMQYEDQHRSSAGWRHQVLLPFDKYGGPSYSIWPSYIAEKIRSNILVPEEWPYHRIYDTTQYGTPETMNCVASNVVCVLTNNQFGLVLWFSHGSPTTTAGQILDTSHAETLSLDYFPIFFQASCQNAYPESTNNLAYTLLKTTALGTVAATRISYYNWGWPFPPGTNNDFLYGFAMNMVQYKLAEGDALFLYKASTTPNNNTRWKNFLDYNLYGCPAVGLRSVRFSGPQWSL